MQYLFVDNSNSVVLATMLDKVTRAYDLDSKQPCIKYVGHDEVVRGIDYLPERGLYVTGMCTVPLCTLCASGHPCTFIAVTKLKHCDVSSHAHITHLRSPPLPQRPAHSGCSCGAESLPPPPPSSPSFRLFSAGGPFSLPPTPSTPAPLRITASGWMTTATKGPAW